MVGVAPAARHIGFFIDRGIDDMGYVAKVREAGFAGGTVAKIDGAELGPGREIGRPRDRPTTRQPGNASKCSTIARPTVPSAPQTSTLPAAVCSAPLAIWQRSVGVRYAMMSAAYSSAACRVTSMNFLVPSTIAFRDTPPFRKM